MTSFILESYTALQPDPKMITIDLLRQIAAQLNGTTVPVAEGLVFGTDVPFEPALTDVLRNSTLFASLICSLLAAGMGIFYKEWLREYTRDLPDDPRELLRTRQYRYVGMQRWRMQEILSGISIFLQLGVAFFILAVVLFAWPLHPIVRLVLNVFVIIWVVFWIGTAFCPLVSADCPFRSPLSRAIFGAISFARYVWRKGRAWVVGDAPGATILLPHTLEAQERGEVRRAGNDLDEGALEHLYNSHWGDAWLANLDPCVLDLDAEVALRLIRNVVSPRCGAASFEDVLKDPEGAVDPEVTRLVKLWKRIERGRRQSPPPRNTPSSGTRVVDNNPARRPAFDRDQTLVSGRENQDDQWSDGGCGTSSTAADAQSITSESTISDIQPAGIPMATFRKDGDIAVHIHAITPERGECMC